MSSTFGRLVLFIGIFLLSSSGAYAISCQAHLGNQFPESLRKVESLTFSKKSDSGTTIVVHLISDRFYDLRGQKFSDPEFQDKSVSVDWDNLQLGYPLVRGGVATAFSSLPYAIWGAGLYFASQPDMWASWLELPRMLMRIGAYGMGTVGVVGALSFMGKGLIDSAALLSEKLTATSFEGYLEDLEKSGVLSRNETGEVHIVLDASSNRLDDSGFESRVRSIATRLKELGFKN